MYCRNCGNEIDDKAVICPKCGVPVQDQPAKRSASNDAPSTGFGVLGFFFPIVGLILYLVWKDETPLKAKSAGKGALIGVIVAAALSIISGIIYGIAMASILY